MSFFYVGFENRMIIEQMFLKWCDENGIAKKPNSLVAFMLSKEWLNEKKIWEDINKMKGVSDDLSIFKGNDNDKDRGN